MKKTIAAALGLLLVFCLSACGDGGGGGGGGSGSTADAASSGTNTTPSPTPAPDTLMLAEGEQRYGFNTYIPTINEYDLLKNISGLLNTTKLQLRTDQPYFNYQYNTWYLTAAGFFTRLHTRPLNTAVPINYVLADDGTTVKFAPVLSSGAKDTMTALLKYERVDVSGQKIAPYLLPSLQAESSNTSTNSKAFMVAMQNSSASFPAGSIAFKINSGVNQTEIVYFDQYDSTAWTSFDQVPEIATNAPLAKTLGGYAIRYHLATKKAYVLYNGKVYNARYEPADNVSVETTPTYLYNTVAGKAVAAEITALCWDTTKFPTDKGCTAP